MKKIVITISIFLIVIFITIGGYIFYNDYRVKHAKKIVKLAKEEVEVYEDIRLKDLIKEINGHLIINSKVDTTKIGNQEIKFEYINDDKIKVPYSININIIDKTQPIISEPGVYSLNVGTTTKEELEKSFFCGDNYDDNPECYLEGDFDLNSVGEYNVTLVGKDSSNNTSTHNFILRVKEETPSSGKKSSNNIITTNFQDVINEYKNENTKIGIDISHWQGTIDFKKVKESGVEFAYIRVGRGNGIGKEYVLDDKFEEYIKGFNKENIPVGVYFYSYANNKKDAINEAKWILKKIKKYKVDLEIAFDWEDWSNFQEFDLSFYHLTETAQAFIDTVEKAGYKGMLYSSKNYLENIWYPIKGTVWLAHYTKQTNYKGKYKVWQICNNGQVDGIDDNLVDIDIMYK